MVSVESDPVSYRHHHSVVVESCRSLLVIPTSDFSVPACAPCLLVCSDGAFHCRLWATSSELDHTVSHQHVVNPPLTATAGIAVVRELLSHTLLLWGHCCMASSSPKSRCQSFLSALLMQRRQLMELSQDPGQQGSAAQGSLFHSSPHLQSQPECVCLLQYLRIGRTNPAAAVFQVLACCDLQERSLSCPPWNVFTGLLGMTHHLGKHCLC